MYTIIIILCILSYITQAITIYVAKDKLKNPLSIIQLILTTIILIYGVLTP